MKGRERNCGDVWSCIYRKERENGVYCRIIIMKKKMSKKKRKRKEKEEEDQKNNNKKMVMNKNEM